MLSLVATLTIGCHARLETPSGAPTTTKDAAVVPPATKPPQVAVSPDTSQNHVANEHGSASQAATTTTASTATTSLNLPGSGPIIHRPQEDGWSTEAWTEAADSQLHKLADWIIEGHRIVAEDVAEVVDAAITVEPLVPTTLDTVFDDAALQVRRYLPDVTDRANPRVPRSQGAAAFAAALNELAAPIREATDRHCKFKVFRLEPTEAGMNTTIWMQLSGVASTGVRQQSSTWRCQWTQPTAASAPRLLSVTIVNYERADSKRSGNHLFADCTEAVLGQEASYREQLAPGLDHWLRRLEVGPSIVATSYHGLAVGDVNGDGLDDLYVCQPGGLAGGLPNRLYVQQPDGTARDASAESGIDWLIETPSALFVDIDNDGDQDLVAATMAGVIFAANDGKGKFRAQTLKVLPEAPPMTLAAADYDRDGDLDLYAGCYASRAATQLVGRPVPYHDANNGARNALFRNDGQWRFTNVTRSVGLDENNHRFTMACAWEDYDNDGDLDLYVANDFGRNNLYRNDQGRFRDVAPELGVEDISAGMSVSWGDYNRDGWMDLYVSNMWSSAGNRVAYQRRFLNEKADAGTLSSFQRHARGNSLFQNRGADRDGGFLDVSEDAAVTMGRWAWSSRFADINNDGWEDIVVANGYITQDDTGDL